MTREELKEFLKDPLRVKRLYNSRLPSAEYHMQYKLLHELTSFLPEKAISSLRVWYVNNDFTSIRTCACGCGKVVSNPIKYNYVQGHSNGDEAVKQKKAQVCRERYGVSNPSQAQEVKDKKEATFKDKYGSMCWFDSKEGQEHTKKVMTERYGVENLFYSKEFQEKYSKKGATQSEDFKKRVSESILDTGYDKIKKRVNEAGFDLMFERSAYVGVGHIKYEFKCQKCNTIAYSNLSCGLPPRCLICNPLISTGGISGLEQEIQDYIRSIEPVIRVRARDIIPKYRELDIYIPSKKIAFEVNGTYWHSTAYNQDIDPDYHLRKTEDCEKLGIRLFHIMEDDWLCHREETEARIRYALCGGKYMGAMEFNGVDDQIYEMYISFPPPSDALARLEKFKQIHKPQEIILITDRMWPNHDYYVNYLKFTHVCNTPPNTRTIDAHGFSSKVEFPVYYDCGDAIYKG